MLDSHWTLSCLPPPPPPTHTHTSSTPQIHHHPLADLILHLIPAMASNVEHLRSRIWSQQLSLAPARHANHQLLGSDPYNQVRSSALTFRCLLESSPTGCQRHARTHTWSERVSDYSWMCLDGDRLCAHLQHWQAFEAKSSPLTLYPRGKICKA